MLRSKIFTWISGMIHDGLMIKSMHAKKLCCQKSKFKKLSTSIISKEKVSICRHLSGLIPIIGSRPNIKQRSSVALRKCNPQLCCWRQHKSRYWTSLLEIFRLSWHFSWSIEADVPGYIKITNIARSFKLKKIWQK